MINIHTACTTPSNKLENFVAGLPLLLLPHLSGTGTCQIDHNKYWPTNYIKQTVSGKILLFPFIIIISWNRKRKAHQAVILPSPPISSTEWREVGNLILLCREGLWGWKWCCGCFWFDQSGKSIFNWWIESRFTDWRLTIDCSFFFSSLSEESRNFPELNRHWNLLIHCLAWRRIYIYSYLTNHCLFHTIAHKIIQLLCF